MDGFTTSPLPPSPLLLRFLGVVFPKRYSYDPLPPTNATGHHQAGYEAYYALVEAPNPPYPFRESSLLGQIFSERFYTASLRSIYPLCFALAYYFVAHALNRIVKKNGSVDHVSKSKLLRYLVLAHNAFLMLYSGWTWIHLFPVAVDYYVQGFRAAGYSGWKAAMGTFSVEAPYLNRYNYLFYISKYYEVIDSVILLLKGKQVGQLQSYHHAGALISMWIAVRYGSENVWVFTTWNSFVHTLMYTYYFFTAMRWPFPRALKKSLTTLQIGQIASGTIYTNFHWFFSLDTATVIRGFEKTGTKSILASIADIAYPASDASESSFTSLISLVLRTVLPTALLRESTTSALQSVPTTAYSHLDLLHNTQLRAASKDPTNCFDTTGAVFALWINTFYMLPLLMLFAQFFIQAYLKGSSSSSRSRKARADGSTNGKLNGHVKA